MPDSTLKTIVLAVFALVVLIGFIFGPLGMSFVYTNSMEPEITPNDVFFYSEHTTPEVGDVVLVDSDETDHVLIHRIVADTQNGFETRGDANPTTDQQEGHPHYNTDDIIGVVFSIGDSPITIPFVGIGVRLINHLGVYGLTGIFALLLGVNTLWNRARTSGIDEEGKRDLDRENTFIQNKTVFNTVFTIALIMIALGVIFGATTVGVTYVVTSEEQAAQGSGNLVGIGEQDSQNVSFNTPISQFTTTVIGGGEQVGGFEMHENTAGELTVTVYNTPQTERGVTTSYITAYHYPDVLPQNTLQYLHERSVVLTAFITGGITIAPFYLLYLIFLDPKALYTSRSLKRSESL